MSDITQGKRNWVDGYNSGGAYRPTKEEYNESCIGTRWWKGPKITPEVMEDYEKAKEAWIKKVKKEVNS